MWLDKVKALRKDTGMTNKYIAEHMHMSERTIARFFAGETSFGIDDVREIVLLMGGSLDDILHESDFKIPTPEVESLKAEMASLSKKLEELTLSESMLKAENGIMKDKIVSLNAENDILRIKLEYEKKISDLHDYYNKLK